MNKGPELFRKELVEICTKGRFYSTGGGTAQFVRNLIVHVCKKMDKNDTKALQDLIRNVIYGLPILPRNTGFGPGHFSRMGSGAHEGFSCLQ